MLSRVWSGHWDGPAATLQRPRCWTSSIMWTMVTAMSAFKASAAFWQNYRRKLIPRQSLKTPSELSTRTRKVITNNGGDGGVGGNDSPGSLSSGNIPAEEMRFVLSNLPGCLTAREVDRMIDTVDRNRDGRIRSDTFRLKYSVRK